MRGRRLALLGLLLAIPAGCGATSRSAPPPPPGRALFAHDCLFCHSLSGHSSPRQQGGDLLHIGLSRAVLTQYTAEMPVLHRPLTAPELRAVVDYVLAVQRSR